MFLAQLGVGTNKLYIWDVFTVCKYTIFADHEVKLGTIKPAPFQSVVWSAENVMLYIIDSAGCIYTVRHSGFSSKLGVFEIIIVKRLKMLVFRKSESHDITNEQTNVLYHCYRQWSFCGFWWQNQFYNEIINRTDIAHQWYLSRLCPPLNRTSVPISILSSERIL